MKIKSYYILSILVMFFLSCKNTDQQKDNKIKTDQKMEGIQEVESKGSAILKSLLDEKKQNFEMNADEKTKTIYKEGIDAIKNSSILSQAKQVGEVAPNFELKNALGKTVELAQYLKKGPVILTWYRGGWCPYCNLTLRQLQNELPNFNANGANLIALSPETPDNSISTTEKHNLEFEVLSDLGNKVAKEYGVVFELTPEVAEIYNKKFNLAEFNGDNSNELPLAATYIINQEGKIIYAFLDADYRNRAEPSELTEIIKGMEISAVK